MTFIGFEISSGHPITKTPSSEASCESWLSVVRDEFARKLSFGRLPNELDNFDKKLGVSGTLEGMKGGEP